jgi:hypothetical protein
LTSALADGVVACTRNPANKSTKELVYKYLHLMKHAASLGF